MEIDSNMRCSVCLGYFVKPISLPCMDKFCMMCIDQWYRSKYSVLNTPIGCPLCKQTFKCPDKWAVDRHLESIVEKHISRLSEEEKVSLKEVLEDRRLAILKLIKYKTVQENPPASQQQQYPQQHMEIVSLILDSITRGMTPERVGTPIESVVRDTGPSSPAIAERIQSKWSFVIIPGSVDLGVTRIRSHHDQSVPMEYDT